MISFKTMMVAALLSCAAMLTQAQVVSVATNPAGSLYYSVGTAVAATMQKDGGLTARVRAMSGSSAYAPLINRGDVEFGLLNAIDVVNAYTGVSNFAGHKNPNLRLVGVMFALRIGIAVPKDSPIKSIRQLKGLRMPSQFTAQSTIRTVQDAVLATGGLSTADMKPFPVANYVKGMVAFGEGKVDAALMCVGCAAGKRVNVALKDHGGIRFLSLDNSPAAAARMHKVFPSAYFEVFKPSARNTGIVGPTRLMVYSAFLASSTHVANDVVYKATKALYENKADLVATSAPMRTFDQRRMAEASVVPYQAGAEKFYKEVGEWPPKKR